MCSSGKAWLRRGFVNLERSWNKSARLGLRLPGKDVCAADVRPRWFTEWCLAQTPVQRLWELRYILSPCAGQIDPGYVQTTRPCRCVTAGLCWKGRARNEWEVLSQGHNFNGPLCEMINDCLNHSTRKKYMLLQCRALLHWSALNSRARSRK